MLNKKICRRCHTYWWDKMGFDLEFEFETDWKQEKKVFCFIDIVDVGDFVSIKGDPPAHCPYALEHLMKAQKNAK